MFRRLFVFIVASCLIFVSAGAFSEEYRWVDEKGVLHFSDNPPPQNLNPEPPLLDDAGPAAKEPDQKPVGGVKPKVKEKAKSEAVVKVQPVKSERPSKLYDLRGKVIQVEGLDIIILATGEKIKYIGVRNPAAFLAQNGLSHRLKEALNFHEKLVVGKTVTVLFGKRKRDREGRFLGHVFLGQESFVNAELIRKGYAVTEDYPSDFEYQSLFIRLQRKAQEKGEGIWSY